MHFWNFYWKNKWNRIARFEEEEVFSDLRRRRRDTHKKKHTLLSDRQTWKYIICTECVMPMWRLWKVLRQQMSICLGKNGTLNVCCLYALSPHRNTFHQRLVWCARYNDWTVDWFQSSDIWLNWNEYCRKDWQLTASE